MEQLVHRFGHYSALSIEAIATAIIVAGCVDALLGITRALSSPSSTNIDRRNVWLQFARWLVAGLTFQMAADIIGTSLVDDWEQLARVGFIGLLRTGLSFFLDREVADTRALQHRHNEACGQ